MAGSACPSELSRAGLGAGLRPGRPVEVVSCQGSRRAAAFDSGRRWGLVVRSPPACSECPPEHTGRPRDRQGRGERGVRVIVLGREIVGVEMYTGRSRDRQQSTAEADVAPLTSASCVKWQI